VLGQLSSTCRPYVNASLQCPSYIGRPQHSFTHRQQEPQHRSRGGFWTPDHQRGQRASPYIIWTKGEDFLCTCNRSAAGLVMVDTDPFEYVNIELTNRTRPLPEAIAECLQPHDFHGEGRTRFANAGWNFPPCLLNGSVRVKMVGGRISKSHWLVCCRWQSWPRMQG
jgi:hypothetical protein